MTDLGSDDQAQREIIVNEACRAPPRHGATAVARIENRKVTWYLPRKVLVPAVKYINPNVD